MDSDWLFVSNGVTIGLGLKAKAKNNTGTVGITSAKELILYNGNGEVIDHAPLAQVVAKFSNMTGDSVKINDNKYILAFIPPMKTSKSLIAGALGGAVGAFAAGMNEGQRPEVQVGRQKREEFKALVERLQAESGASNNI